VAFGAITFSGPAKGFLAVMAGPAKFTRHMVGLGHLRFFLHLEDFRMAFRAFKLVAGRGMAEEDRPRASLRLKFYVPPAYFFLSSRAQGCQAYDANQDGQKSPEFLAHIFTPFLSNFSLAQGSSRFKILFLVTVYPYGKKFVKGKNRPFCRGSWPIVSRE
jgi:hypothetical protein